MFEAFWLFQKFKVKYFQWTCELEALRQVSENKIDEVKVQRTDFTKKGAQRLAALEFLKLFSEETRQAWSWAIEIANEKLEKSDGVDKSKLIHSVFQRLAQKKPTKVSYFYILNFWFLKKNFFENFHTFLDFWIFSCEFCG